MYDEPRSGRPPIYTLAEAAQLCDWLAAEPRQIKQVHQARLEQATGKRAAASRRQAVRLALTLLSGGAGPDLRPHADCAPCFPRQGNFGSAAIRGLVSALARRWLSASRTNFMMLEATKD